MFGENMSSTVKSLARISVCELKILTDVTPRRVPYVHDATERDWWNGYPPPTPKYETPSAAEQHGTVIALSTAATRAYVIWGLFVSVVRELDVGCHIRRNRQFMFSIYACHERLEKCNTTLVLLLIDNKTTDIIYVFNYNEYTRKMSRTPQGVRMGTRVCPIERRYGW